MSLLPRVKFSVNTNYADSVAPTVSSVSTSVSDGTYALDAVIPIIVNFNKAVYVTTTGGTPQITIETGGVDRVVPYSSGSGTSALTFNYTVQSGDESPDLDYVGTGSLVLNGGLILSGTGVAANLTLPSPGAAGSLSNGRAIVVDGAAPTLVSATFPSAGNSLSILFSSIVNIGVGGNGGFTIAMSGGAVTLTYASGAGSNTLVYTPSRIINSGETCSDFDYTQPGSGVEDAAGNDLASFSNQQASVTNSSTVGGGALTPDLVWWQFTEGSGTTVADSSTAGTNGGTITGATWVPGKNGVGNALSFDGVNDFLASTANLTFGVKKCTVCAWVYFPSFADNDAVLWEHSVNQNSNQNTYVAIPNAASGLFNATYRGNGYRSETIARPTAGYWRHVAITYDVETTTAADVEIYFDGVLQSTSLAVNTNSSSANNIATLVTYFMSRGGSSLFLPGKLYDVRIYKSKLTQPQIEAIKLVSLGGQALCEDTFNRTNADPMSTTMSDGVSTWTNGPGALGNPAIVSNAMNAPGTQRGAVVLSPTFTANQRAVITLTAQLGVGAMVRMQSGLSSGYLVYLSNATTLQVYRIDDSGTIGLTQLGGNITISSVTSGDTIGAEITGTTITALRNGVSVGTRTDATFASGQPGVYMGGSGVTIDAFTSTDI